MSDRPLDVLFVEVNSSENYQDLARDFTAIETPTWSLLLAQSCRAKGFGVAILDANAERLTHQEAAKRAKEYDSRLIVMVVYGQNPNSGTTNMGPSLRVASEIKKICNTPICFVGSHTSALPKEVLADYNVDFVLLNEGVYALHNLLKTDLKTDLHKVKGIGYKWEDHTILNEPERIVPQSMMDIDLPGYAWDLLPYRNKPFDLYRAHFWHANFDYNLRTPFAAIYTSLGCRFGCSYCMINILNRTNNDDNISAGDSRIMRFWSPDFIFKEFYKLVNDYGISTIRISDELFFLDKRYFEPLLNKFIESGIGQAMRLWTYSRVDTVREKYLELFKKAGMSYLALGIESASQKIRQEITKGTFKEIDIRDVVKDTRDAGINVIANYMYGLPHDDYKTMQETLDLSLELNTEMMNCYSCMALPGSPLYIESKNKGEKLPESFSAFGFLSYDCQPMRTEYLTAEEVLAFRDKAWKTYFTNPSYLNLVEDKFGKQQRTNVENMTKIKLRRKILGD